MTTTKKQKLTPWFKGGELPARRGVYQQQNPLGELGYQRWDGGYWFAWCSTAEAAATQRMPVATQFRRDPWRGLTENPMSAGRTKETP